MKKLHLISVTVGSIIVWASLNGQDIRAYSAERKTGGPCEYVDYIGESRIVRVEKTIRSVRQVNALGGPRYEGYEIQFIFSTNEQIKETWAKNYLVKEHLFQLANSWYPGDEYIEKYAIKPGKIFRCTMRVISEGTCSPIIFEFDDLKKDDYFETRPGKAPN